MLELEKVGEVGKGEKAACHVLGWGRRKYSWVGDIQLYGQSL